MKNHIEVRNLCHSYGRHVIYKNLNFTVKRGKIFGLLGKNGVGKTTLINILMGFLRPTSGRCLVLGEDSYNLSPETRRKIGLVFEGHLAYEFMTIAQIESFYSGFFPELRRDLYYDLIDKMGLSYKHKISNMSCGQRSQLVLGLVLAQNPELMILDDYSMGLDAGYRRLFLDYLTEYVKDGAKTVLVTSHIVQDMEKLVDDVLFIIKGEPVIHTSVTEFMNNFRLFQFKKGGRTVTPHKDDIIKNVEVIGSAVSLYSFEKKETVEAHLRKNGINFNSLKEVPMTLEDAFIGLTGKY